MDAPIRADTLIEQLTGRSLRQWSRALTERQAIGAASEPTCLASKWHTAHSVQAVGLRHAISALGCITRYSWIGGPQGKGMVREISGNWPTWQKRSVILRWRTATSTGWSTNAHRIEMRGDSMRKNRGKAQHMFLTSSAKTPAQLE